MKPKYQTLIVISAGVLVIALAVSYVAINNFNFSDESQEDLNPEEIKALREEVRQEIKDFKLKKIVRKDRGALVLRKENFTQISSYQKYVTPFNKTVRDYINSENIDSRQKAYSTAVKWIWVSDQTLHNKAEHWLLPAQFINLTPNMPTNPQAGSMVSDCESQAYTLVSILESIGISSQNVRVCVGEVNFSGETGGHAWVQVYENNEWYELEATSGPFWDDDDNILVNNIGFPYNYFKNHPYPVEENWAFFNNEYYYNPDTGKKSLNLPEHWLI